MGPRSQAAPLVERVLAARTRSGRLRPSGPRWKAPLSFHFLGAGHDTVHAACVTGRINKTTTWVPLVKAQSVRRTQGPVQRRLGLATVRVDVAGKRTRAAFKDRCADEADRLVEELVASSRTARATRPGPGAATRWR